jgi:hypothetical protein
MPGIVEQISALAGTELAKAADLAHSVFQDRVATHGHAGRALIETIVEICRNHPNMVGIGVGLLVEQILLAEKHRHDHEVAEHAAEAHPADPHAPQLPHQPGQPEHEMIVPDHPAAPAHPVHPAKPRKPIHPLGLAFEVFGGLLVLKLGALGSALFRRDHHAATWLADAAKIHIISASIAAYYIARTIRAPRISAWRHAAIALFATDAIKPLLKPDRRRIAAARHN